MIAFLSQIVFMQPIILSALLALPLLWYLLRITPPAPKTIIFPPARFLTGLIADQNSPSKSPWWILLLRLLILTLIIIALAKPVINPADELPEMGAVRIIVDNSWAAAQSWEMQMDMAEETVSQAGREQRELYIVTTTPAIGESEIKQYGPLSHGDAISIVRGLTPNPWSADYSALINTIRENKENKSIYSAWLAHGLDEGDIANALSEVQNQGSVRYISPSPEKLPLLLRPAPKSINSKASKSDIEINVNYPSNINVNKTISVSALAQTGDIIDVQTTKLKANKASKTISFDVPNTLKGDIAKFKINGASGAGSVFLIDDQFTKRKVGIASTAQKESSAPLIEASYFLKRALETSADIMIGEITELIKADMSVIILPDIAAMPAHTLNDLEEWVKNGGLLLRFSGENIAKTQGSQFLLPVILRAGGKTLSGSLSWDEQQKIAPFGKDSPFYGLEIPDDININQYVLADPTQNLKNKVWAQLSDGTPFITASPYEKGLIALIHTSANTSWSNFALSGLYVSILKRITKLAGYRNITVDGYSNYSSLNPILIMDGYGALISPPASVKPLQISDLKNFTPTSIHPAGLYGHGKLQYAINIGDNLDDLKAVENLPSSMQHSYYDSEYEINLMPLMLYAALVLFLIDWSIMIFILGNGSMIFRKFASILFISMLAIAILPSQSFASKEPDMQFAAGLHLAYIKTGNPSIDETSKDGLEILSSVLERRTSIEPIGVVGIDPENDIMVFFPLIYWAIDESQKEFSSNALKNIQDYLDHGGSILFDTRDQNRSTNGITNTPNAKALRKITAFLNIPPIMPIPEDHVLGRSFYLLNEYTGQYSSGTLWVEQQSAAGRDNVSSVLIGSNNWAKSWASTETTTIQRYNRNNISKQKEMALRFGVNLVMYALTGNYKTDQVHIPHILKRLGK